VSVRRRSCYRRFSDGERAEPHASARPNPGGFSTVSEVLQCPYCDLRFSTRSELEQHKALDHVEAREEQAPKAVEPDHETPKQESEERVEKAERMEKKRGFLSRLFKGQ
jgi:hypothetical protein